jgi:hypothetical protein
VTHQPPVGQRHAVPTAVALLGAYALSRLMVFAAMEVVNTLQLGGARCGDAVARPIVGFDALARCWDSRWFLNTAQQWYPAGLPAPGEQSTLAFFPGYPALIAGGSALGLPPLVVAVTFSLLFGALATLGVWQLAGCVTPPDVAVRAALLFCFFPGAVVLSWAYSEALSTALVAACLVLLYRHRWEAAGLAAAAAGATRLDVGLGVTVAAACAAVLAIRRDGEWRALWAALLAPLGVVAFWLFLWWRTGSPRAWTIAQDRGWDQHMDAGSHAVRTIWRVLSHPVSSPTSILQLVTLILLVAALVCFWQLRAPAPWVAYTAAMILVLVVSNQVGFRPRAILLLLPLFVAAAWRLPAAVVPWVVGGFAVLQTLAVVMYLGVPLIIPP